MNKFERDTPLVSIVIPAWFEEGQDGKYGENETFWFAWECLDRLQEVTPRDKYELIIIDNGSDDLTYESHQWDADDENWRDPRDYFGEADILIANQSNLGFAPAINQGIAVARGKYVVCLNNDILVWPGWLDAMLLAFHELLLKPGVVDPGVIMPALIRETRDAREALKIKNIKLTSNFEKYHPGAEFGSCFMAPKFILDRVADFRDGYQVLDENFKLGFGEDRLLWQEIRRLGYETYRTHKTRVFHQGNMSMGKIPDRKIYTEKNHEYLEKKTIELWGNKIK